MLDLRRKLVEQQSTLSFGEFHALVSKSMPDVTKFPQMYNLCYDLMKLAWETAQKQNKS